MTKEFATKDAREGLSEVDDLHKALADLKSEIELRKGQSGFFGTVAIQVSFQNGQYSFHRVTSEYTRRQPSK